MGVRVCGCAVCAGLGGCCLHLFALCACPAPPDHLLSGTRSTTCPLQVRILKYLLTVESEADRDSLLAQAFEPGAPRRPPPLQPGCWMLPPAVSAALPLAGPAAL